MEQEDETWTNTERKTDNKQTPQTHIGHRRSTTLEIHKSVKQNETEEQNNQTKGTQNKTTKRARHKKKTKQDGNTTKQTRQGHIMETKKTRTNLETNRGNDQSEKGETPMENDMHITTETETVKQQQTTTNVETHENTDET